MTPEEARTRAAATYNAAADSCDHPANSFWDRYGRRTVAARVVPRESEPPRSRERRVPRGDMLDLGLRARDFEAVICVFGISFVPDMEAAIRELWRLVRSGGQLASWDRVSAPEAESRERVRHDCLQFIPANQVSSVETNVVYALATSGP